MEAYYEFVNSMGFVNLPKIDQNAKIIDKSSITLDDLMNAATRCASQISATKTSANTFPSLFFFALFHRVFDEYSFVTFFFLISFSMGDHHVIRHSTKSNLSLVCIHTQHSLEFSKATQRQHRHDFVYDYYLLSLWPVALRVLSIAIVKCSI